jgi:hypothetical protein
MSGLFWERVSLNAARLQMLRLYRILLRASHDNIQELGFW